MECLGCKEEFENVLEKGKDKIIEYRYCRKCRRKYGQVKNLLKKEFAKKDADAREQVYGRFEE